jgi:hypothetical protein
MPAILIRAALLFVAVLPTIVNIRLRKKQRD